VAGLVLVTSLHLLLELLDESWFLHIDTMFTLDLV
jgi:hypothetical protein